LAKFFFLTAFELALFISQLDSKDVSDIRRRLLQQNRTWRIPERRVRKFVKRQTCQGYDTDSVFTETDDAVSVTSVRDRVLGMVKETGRFLGSTQTTQSVIDTVPVFEIDTTRSLLSQMGVEFDAADNGSHDVVLSPIQETPSKSVGMDAFSPSADNETPSFSFNTPTGRVVLAERFYNAVSEERKENGSHGNETLDMYKDDNDGKKERRCGVCDGCAVM
jgi:hypothetical protein